jgi:hypothetical protein
VETGNFTFSVGPTLRASDPTSRPTISVSVAAWIGITTLEPDPSKAEGASWSISLSTCPGASCADAAAIQSANALNPSDRFFNTFPSLDYNAKRTDLEILGSVSAAWIGWAAGPS